MDSSFFPQRLQAQTPAQVGFSVNSIYLIPIVQYIDMDPLHPPYFFLMGIIGKGKMCRN